jgi:RNA polymerase sigma-70 factor (ECF subfamily)
MTQPPDDSLARQARRDPKAFSELYQRHVNAVYRFVLARTGNEQDAQDLTTETFMSALESIGNFREGGSFRAWLLGIARNKVADFYRTHRQAISLEAAESVIDPDPLPDEKAMQSLQMERVMEVINLLTPDRAEAFTLRIWGGLSAAEIGEIMGKSEASVKMLVHRAWKDLKLRLAPAGGGEHYE